MISLCITTYQRVELLQESFRHIINNDRIYEVVIVDDHSTMEVFSAISELAQHHDKIKLFRNEKNLGCYRNKREAVSKASNKPVILLDSDNIIYEDYIDALVGARKNGLIYRPTLLQPVFARPHFDFREFEGLTITKKNVHKYIGNDTFATALNAMNYLVNRDEYLRVWEDRPEPWTADSLLQNYNWLKAGNSIYFCPGLEYYHRVDDHGKEEISHYKEHHRKTGTLYNELIDKLKAMR